MNDLLTKIQIFLNHYAVNDIRYILSKYIMFHMDEMPIVTLNAIVLETGVSKASIMKYCKELGFVSWKYFISELSDEINTYHSQMSFIKTNRKFINYTNQEEVYEKQWKLYRQLITVPFVQDVCQTIHEAKRVFIYSSSCELAYFKKLQVHLALLQKEVILVEDMFSNEDMKKIEDINEDDFIMIVTPSHPIEIALENHGHGHNDFMYKIMSEHVKKLFIGQGNQNTYYFKNFHTLFIPFTTEDILYDALLLNFTYQLMKTYISLYK